MTIIEEAIKTTTTAAAVIMSHVGTEVPEEFIPWFAEPHLSLAVSAGTITGRHVSMICAVIILIPRPYNISVLLFFWVPEL